VIPNNERHAVSDDEPTPSGSASDGTEEAPDAGGQTVVVTRPLRPTGKRTRREAAVVEDEVADAAGDDESESQPSKSATKKTKKAKDSTPRRNPFVFVWTFLTQVVAELRKVIWPNRKQMVSYTTVVLVFLVFMVALIGGVDLGLAKLVMLVFG
jgi:preprotein translocase subunit SecE